VSAGDADRAARPASRPENCCYLLALGKYQAVAAQCQPLSLPDLLRNALLWAS